MRDRQTDVWWLITILVVSTVFGFIITSKTIKNDVAYEQSREYCAQHELVPMANTFDNFKVICVDPNSMIELPSDNK